MFDFTVPFCKRDDLAPFAGIEWRPSVNESGWLPLSLKGDIYLHMWVGWLRGGYDISTAAWYFDEDNRHCDLWEADYTCQLPREYW